MSKANNIQAAIPSNLTNSNSKSNDIEKHIYKFALENSNIGAWEYNTLTQVVFYSKETKKILGYEEHEFGSTTKEWNDRVHPEDKEHYFQDFNNHIIGLNPDYVNEHRIKCKDGSYKWILDKGRVIERDIYGKPIRIIGTHTDINDQKENELNLANSIDLITEQYNKLKNFAHIVSHNLKTYSGNFENLLEFHKEAKTHREKEEIIGYLQTVSTSLTKTITNLNDIVSIQGNKNKDISLINVVQYISNATKLLKIDIDEFETIINNEICKNLLIAFNPAYFESIIHNLMSNAIKYKHPNRNLVLNIKSYTTPEHIILEFNDNGIGIDLNKYGSDIFQLYRTFHNNENAEGVGLYLTKSQIEAFNGTISVESTVNVGSTFIIKLPKKNLAIN